MKYTKKRALTSLIERVRRNDETAFEELYDKTHEKVFFLAYSMTREQYLAEDIVQEVYIKMYGSLDTLRDNRLFLAWLNKITYNMSMDVLEKHKDICMEDIAMDKLMPPVEEQEPLDQVVQREWQDVLMDFILDLPEELKSAVIMRYYEDMRMEEISVSLDCPIGTVKSRLHNAKRILRQRLTERKMKLKGVFLGSVIFLAMNHYMENQAIAAMTSSSAAEVIPAGAISGGGLLGWAARFAGAASYAKPLAAAVGLFGTLTTVGYMGFTNIAPEIVAAEVPEGYSNTWVLGEIEVKTIAPIERVDVIGEEGEVIPVECSQEDSKYQVKFEQNGIYQVTVTASNQKTAVSCLEVKNIDKGNPRLTQWRYEEEIGMLTAIYADDESGIDYERCYLEVGGNRTSLGKWDSGKNEMRINLDDHREATLGLYDRSGNYSFYRLLLEEHMVLAY